MFYHPYCISKITTYIIFKTYTVSIYIALRLRFCLIKRMFKTREQNYRNTFSDLSLVRDTNESENNLN